MLRPFFYFFIGLYFQDCPLGAYYLSPQHIPLRAQILDIVPHSQMVSIGGKDSVEQASFWAQVKIKNPYYSDFKEGQLVEMEFDDICDREMYGDNDVLFLCAKKPNSTFYAIEGVTACKWGDYHCKYKDSIFTSLQAYHQWLFAEPERTGLHTYNCNENCRLEAFFDKGQLHGKYKVYNSKHQVLLDGQFIKGKPSGVWEIFVPEGYYFIGKDKSLAEPAWGYYHYHTKTGKIIPEAVCIKRITNEN